MRLGGDSKRISQPTSFVLSIQNAFAHLIWVYEIITADRFNSGISGTPGTPQKPTGTVYPPDEDYDHICAIYLDRFQPIWPILKVADVHATRRPKCIKDIIFRQVCDSLESVANGGCMRSIRPPLRYSSHGHCCHQHQNISLVF